MSKIRFLLEEAYSLTIVTLYKLPLCLALNVLFYKKSLKAQCSVKYQNFEKHYKYFEKKNNML